MRTCLMCSLPRYKHANLPTPTPSSDRTHRSMSLAPTASSPGPNVVLSFVLARQPYLINHVLRNALKFTSAPMIVSFERDTGPNGIRGGVTHSMWCGTYGKTELLLAQTHRDRVRINPQVSAPLVGPAVLAAHWSNLEFCERPGLPCSGSGSGDIRFVLLEGHQLLIRPGLEQWVTQHSVAFCASGDCSVLPGNERVAACVAVRQSRPSRFLSGVHRDLLAEYGTLFGVASTLPPEGSSALPVMPHDGTFFPVWLLREFQRTVASLLPAFEHLRRSGECRWANATVATACALHEMLLPLFVRGRFAHLLPTASPPIIFPIGGLGNVSRCGGARQLASDIHSMAAPDARVFGVSLQGTWFSGSAKEGVVQLASALNEASGVPQTARLFAPLASAMANNCTTTCEPNGKSRGFSDCASRGRGTKVACKRFTRDWPGQQLVACVGDSITSGVTATGRENTYPAVLQRLLGPSYKVANLGVAGAQLQREHPFGPRYEKGPGYRPYWSTQHFARLNDTKWDVAVIMLGTNDALGNTLSRSCKTQTDANDGKSVHCRHLTVGLESLIAQLRSNGVPRVLVAVPPPLLREDAYGLDQTSVNRVVPQQIRAVAEANRRWLAHPPIDVFGALGGLNQSKAPWECSMLTPHVPRCALFSCDRTHPSDTGYEKIARLVHSAIARASCNHSPTRTCPAAAWGHAWWESLRGRRSG